MMILLSLFLIFTVADKSLGFALGPYVFTPGLSTLFLFYLAARRDHKTLVIMLVALVLTRQTAPTHFLLLTGIYGIGFLAYHKLVRSLFADTYLVNGLWIFLFSVTFEVLITLGAAGDFSVINLLPVLTRSTLQSLVLFSGTLPFFILGDRLAASMPFADKSFAGNKRAESIL